MYVLFVYIHLYIGGIPCTAVCTVCVHALVHWGDLMYCIHGCILGGSHIRMYILW